MIGGQAGNIGMQVDIRGFDPDAGLEGGLDGRGGADLRHGDCQRRTSVHDRMFA
jgi:hypothetical protein